MGLAQKYGYINVDRMLSEINTEQFMELLAFLEIQRREERLDRLAAKAKGRR